MGLHPAVPLARRLYTQHMSGERLARVALALDAVFCGVMGLLVIVFRARIGAIVWLPALLAGALGVAVIGWAYVVLGQTVRMDWRRGIKQTVASNVIVASLLALGAALHPGRSASALMAFLSLDVIAIAVMQALSLLRGRSRS